MTPNPTTDPPIFILNEDLLWSIFHLNADMFTDQKALETTRLTSQVCSSWRNLMLAAPSLWGRLIDLDALLRNSADRWGHELLRRSGEALLWIKSSSIIAEAPLALLLHILEGSWLRIQRLALSINSSHFKVNAKSWDKFYLPAPHLQTFKVSIQRFDPTEWLLFFMNPFDDWSSAGRILFDNKAPALVEFYASWYKIPFQTSWTAGLSSLSIGHPYQLQEVLSTLQNSPNLRILNIVSTSGSMKDNGVPLPRVNLPKLEHFKVTSDRELCSTPCISLLEHVNTPPNCGLEFVPSSFHELSEDFLKSSVKVLSNLARRYFQYYESRPQELQLFLSYSKNKFSLYNNNPRGPKLYISIPFKLQFPSYLLSFTFEQFIFRAFSQVTYLGVNLDDPLPKEIIVPFLSHFSSVKRIDTASESTLLPLCDLSDNLEEQGHNPPTMFPNLVILTFHPYIGHYEAISPLSRDQVLHKFLKHRREIGFPVGVLDLTECEALDGLSSDYLEEMNGLLVLLAKGNNGQMLWYECGSGHPEALDFRRR